MIPQQNISTEESSGIQEDGSEIEEISSEEISLVTEPEDNSETTNDESSDGNNDEQVLNVLKDDHEDGDNPTEPESDDENPNNG